MEQTTDEAQLKLPPRKKAEYPRAYEKIDTPEAWEIYRTGFEDGFNDCLDEIERGGAEWND